MQDEEIKGLALAGLSGDMDSMESLVRRIHGPLMSLLYMRGIPQADIDDVAQDVAVEMCRSLERFQPDKPFMPWFRSIVRHLTAHYWRRKGREKNRLEVFKSYVDEEVVDTPHEALLFGFENETLMTCIGKLLPKYREMLTQRYLRGLSAADVAKMMSMTAAAVRQSLVRTRTTLRDCMTAQVELAVK